MGEERFRSRIYWVTFLFSFLVIWQHSYNGALFLADPNQAAALQQLEGILADRLGQMAVPGFFMVSAYLFYRRFDLGKLPYKWKSRLFSVAIPYCIWNFLYYAAYAAASRIPALAGAMGRGLVPLGIGPLLKAVFFYEYNPVFWYLYQLILLIALAPVIYLVMRSSWSAAAAGAALTFAIWKGWDIWQINEDALLYYCAGAWAALHREGLGSFVEKGKVKDWLLPGLFLGLCGAAAVCLNRPGRILWNNPLAVVTVRLVMASAAWALVSLLPLPEARSWMKNSFFLYAFHFLPVRLINKVAARLFPGNPTAALALFVLMPGLMTAAAWQTVRLLDGCWPKLCRLLSGGRQ